MSINHRRRTSHFKTRIRSSLDPCMRPLFIDKSVSHPSIIWFEVEASTFSDQDFCNVLPITANVQKKATSKQTRSRQHPQHPPSIPKKGCFHLPTMTS